MKIWCLFSARDFEHAKKDLLCWWPEKPSVETLAGALWCDTAEKVRVAGAIWSEQPSRCPWLTNETDTYRLEQVEEGMR